jgi:DGQHR domain-containing protein
VVGRGSRLASARSDLVASLGSLKEALRTLSSGLIDSGELSLLGGNLEILEEALLDAGRGPTSGYGLRDPLGDLRDVLQDVRQIVERTASDDEAEDILSLLADFKCAVEAYAIALLTVGQPLREPAVRSGLAKIWAQSDPNRTTRRRSFNARGPSRERKKMARSQGNSVSNQPGWVKLPCIQGRALGFEVFRGYAPLSLLAKISKPDIYDQVANPTGTQRDLKPKHAAEVHDYAQNEELGFFPEVVLNVRSWDDDNIQWQPLEEGTTDGETQFGYLSVNPAFYSAQPEVLISRVDGNHRLWFAEGTDEDFPQVDRMASFCVLNIEEWDPRELKIFRDVNETPVRMSATHLQQAILRLHDEAEQKEYYPHIWIAKQLGDDPKSPFHGQVYKGAGSKRGYLVKLNQLSTFAQEFRQTAQKSDVLEDVAAQYHLVRDFWQSVHDNLGQCFAEPGKYVVLKSPGLIAMGRICASLVDDAIASGDASPKGVLKDPSFFDDRIGLAAKSFNWASGKDGTFSGLQGKAGGQKIAKKVITAIYKKREGVDKRAS